jgi:HD-GYP domain-containing protein (c-di-GMP phosphodiesterase class II)
MRRVLFHGRPAPGEPRELAGGDVRAEPFRADGWSLEPDEVGVVIGDPGLSSALAVSPPDALGEAADRVGLVFLGEPPEGLAPFWSARLAFSLPAGAEGPHLARAVRSTLRGLEERTRAVRDRRELVARTAESRALVEVGIGLSAETDRERLLGTILTRARALTAADAGSLYLVPPDGSSLHFALAQNDSVQFEFQAATLPLDETSIAGFVARTGSTVHLADARAIPEGAPYRFDPAFDERYRYRTRSVLAVAMRTPAGRIIGVLQLINRIRRSAPTDAATTAFLRREVVPFDDANVEIARSLAAQAAVAVENRRLHESIRSLFEGFVSASVTAIEQRDPATSGHSERVARLSVGLAEAAERTDTGPYAAFRISREELRELRYAAVLHDFGKVGVREHVLVKARKLLPDARRLVRARFDAAASSAAAEIWEAAARGGWEEARVTELLTARRAELERAWETILRADEPTVLAQEAGVELASLRGRSYRDASGELSPLLTDEELACLAIPLGSLTPPERAEIQSHVTQTFRFLARIPWTDDLARVPDWAYAHHEKLDGSGYPRKLKAEALPAPVRMLTICDVYDALAARDRPYKKAVPAETALGILAEEARRGGVDADLLRIFVEAGVWRTIPAS